eukprot:Phypoly_transcript_11321.p1 GENE.Phypoly_transcript_11321~~Phypoly_transcript_11321.p1  ORF type:complete len:395 (+),score=85.71 Phypoly_transcript_11321:91-1185(+)
MASNKENVTPITPLANAFHGLMQSSSPIKTSFAARLKNYESYYEATAEQNEGDNNTTEFKQKMMAHLDTPTPDQKASPLKILSPTKHMHVSLGSPTKKGSPIAKRSSPHKSPKGRTGLKHKRIKNLMHEVQSVKDFSKLQEEVNENREKISSLHTHLTSVQKEKDSIASQLQIVEDIKLHLMKQMEEKHKQLEVVQADTCVLNDRLSNMEKSLEQSLSELEREKGERMDQSVKRAKTEVVSALKTKNYTQEMTDMAQQLKDLKEENAKALAYLELANSEKEKAKEQENTITTLHAETTQKYLSLKQDFFISTCLAIKLNLSRINRPVNVHVEELWEMAQAQDIAIEQFPKFITAEIRKYYESNK